jgi:uncharacterized protein (DUF2147 family)
MLTLLAVFAAGLCFAADAVEGFWISVDDKTGKPTAGWEIYQAEGTLYGRILSLAGFSQDVKADKCKDSYKGFPVVGTVREMTVVGTPWIFGLTVDRPGFWKDGSIIDPDNGTMYGCEITFHGVDGKKYPADTLEMRGKVGPFGRSQFWQRATREEASALR